MTQRVTIESNHPLLVSVETGDLKGCELAQECRMWGSGLLRVTQLKEQSYSGHVILTSAGCENCARPSVTQGDLRLIAYEDVKNCVTRDEALTRLATAASGTLAAVVEGFTP